MNRHELLMYVDDLIVRGDRNKTNGEPIANHEDIAAFWSQYKGISFTPLDVAIMMVLVKISRVKRSPQQPDHYADMAGYAAIAGEISDYLYNDPEPEPDPAVAKIDYRILPVAGKSADYRRLELELADEQ